MITIDKKKWSGFPLEQMNEYYTLKMRKKEALTITKLMKSSNLANKLSGDVLGRNLA